MEGVVGTKNLRYKHVSLFSDNTVEVSWKQRGAAKKSAVAERLIIVLSLRQIVARASLLVAAHVAGDLNGLVNIPSRLFGYSKQWH